MRLVQRASGLDPAENLAALDEVAALPGETDLVVLPEAFARDFGEAGSDLAPWAEDARRPLRRPRPGALGRRRRLAGRHVRDARRTPPGR